ncbi:glycosyltransferase family protein [Pseudomonas soli]|uniref:glycosyltransferase family protein n=1 Tax=Pseudomonas soli TaxID=1306993 RepID=UPI0003C79802
MSKAGIEVLVVIEGDIATTQLIEQILGAVRDQGIVYRKQYLSALKAEDIRQHTVPLFIRCGDPLMTLWIDCLRAARHPYLYYIDDNFWEITGSSPVAHYYRQPSVRSALEVAVVHAWQVLTNSEVLAAYLARFNTRMTVLPASFDFSLLGEQCPPCASEVRIGFAGSPSRVDDLDIIAPLVISTLDTFPDVAFEFAGALPPGLEESERVRFFEHVGNYEQFIHFKQSRGWAIGLAPLHDSVANRCKTNNKYREYSACNIPAIYTDIPPYQGSVVDGRTGLLVSNTLEAWREALERLIRDPELRHSIASAAHDDVLRLHAAEVVACAWGRVLREADAQVRRANPRALRVRSLNFVKRVSCFVQSILLRVRIVYSGGGVLGVARKAVFWVFRQVGSRFDR